MLDEKYAKKSVKLCFDSIPLSVKTETPLQNRLTVGTFASHPGLLHSKNDCNLIILHCIPFNSFCSITSTDKADNSEIIFYEQKTGSLKLSLTTSSPC